MLTINNLDKIVGMVCWGRPIKSVRETEQLKQHRYEFIMDDKFNYLNNPNISLNTSSNKKEIEVILQRKPLPNGKYALFVMGWQARSQIEITSNHLRNPNFLSSSIIETIEKVLETLV